MNKVGEHLNSMSVFVRTIALSELCENFLFDVKRLNEMVYIFILYSFSFPFSLAAMNEIN